MSAHGKGEGSLDQREWPRCHKLVQCGQKWSKLLFIFFRSSLGNGASTAMGCCGVRGAGWVCAMYVQHLLVSHQLLSTCSRAASFCMGDVSLNLNFLLLFFFVAMETHEPTSKSSCILSPASHVVFTPEGGLCLFLRLRGNWERLGAEDRAITAPRHQPKCFGLWFSIWAVSAPRASLPVQVGQDVVTLLGAAQAGRERNSGTPARLGDLEQLILVRLHVKHGDRPGVGGDPRLSRQGGSSYLCPRLWPSCSCISYINIWQLV